MTDQKPGNETSEFKVAQSAGLWGVIATVLGAVITAGSAVLEAVGNSTVAGIIVGGVVAIAGIAMKVLVSLGYIEARKEVKVAAEGIKYIHTDGGVK